MALFEKGNTFGTGRPKGSRNLSTLIREYLRHDAPERAATIIDNVLDAQKMEGVRALRQLSPRPSGESVEIELPEIKTAADILAAQNIIMQATARGDITTERGQELMRMVDSQRGALELFEIEERIRKLEEFDAKRNALRKSIEEATKR